MFMDVSECLWMFTNICKPLLFELKMRARELGALFIQQVIVISLPRLISNYYYQYIGRYYLKIWHNSLYRAHDSPVGLWQNVGSDPDWLCQKNHYNQ